MKAILPIRSENKARVKAEAIKQVDAILLKKCLDMDTVVMWILHRNFGFGKDRCKRFYDSYRPTIRGFRERYDADGYVKMREDLLRDGIDVERWEQG